MSAGKAAPAAADADVMLPRIESRIVVVREHKVIIDADLAVLYGVPTKALNQAVKRNAERLSVRLHVPALGRREDRGGHRL
jgi:ORF6N domain